MKRKIVLVALTLATFGCSTGSSPTASGTSGTVDSSSTESHDGQTPSVENAAASDDDSHRPKPPPLPDLTRFVNPFIGTAKAPNVSHPVGGGSGGSVFPGASVPWGSVAFSPDTPMGEPSGYAYEDSKITGFSLTHFSGAGCPNGGDLPILALADPTETAFAFQHAHEHAAPGYYDVTSDSNVRVELTTTLRTGMARFTFPAGSKATLVFDASRSQTARKITSYQVDPAATNDGLSGHTIGGRFCGGGAFPLYYTLRFDRAWAAAKIENGKAVLSFDTSRDATVEMKIGISYFNPANSKLNLESETKGFDFDGVRAAAAKAWNDRLNAIEVSGGADDDKVKLYTALYHSMLHPNVYSDVNGDYLGFDWVPYKAPAGHAQYANFSGWDIYRSQVQLSSLLFPDVWRDVAQSLVNDARQCGAFPKWSQNNVEDNVMVGDPGSLIVANAYAFGAKSFDTAAAISVMRDMSLVPGTACNGAVELPALDSYIGLGYTPANWSASDALEYAARDAAVAQFAKALGVDDLARIVGARSAYWRNQLNTSATPNVSIQPRNGDGSWPTPIAPADGFNNGFTEASAEQYTWFVPHDLRGLFDAFGGNGAVVPRLDTFFTQINAGGTSPYCYIGNEPDFTTPFLYDWAGAPWRTQDVVRRALTEAFSTAPGGLPGNDDLGATSSLVVWLMMGLYPELPGVGGVAIASPSFSRVTMHLAQQKAFTITASGLPGRYVQSAKLDGIATTSLWLPVEKILAGATLDFVLGDAPSKWGSAPADAPPSFGPGSFAGLSAAFNARGIASDSAADSGNCDGYGWSYSEEALAAAGASGASFTFDGVTFPWPAKGSALDHFVPSGQTIGLATAQKGGKLAFLGSATAGPSTGTGTLTYTDGTAAPFTLGFGDWTLGGGKGQVLPGTQVALRTTYRNRSDGAKDPVATYVFYAAVPLEAGKTLASVTLPPTVSAGRMHVFSLAIAP